MTRYTILFLTLLFFAACAPLTKSQVAAVNSFATASGDFSAYPSKIMTELADIRMQRGVYFANSIDNPSLHIQELDNIYGFHTGDYVLSAKVDITFQIIDKYAQSLLLLSSDKYNLNLKQQAARFGTGLDSLTRMYNAKISPKVPTGIGAGISQLIAFGGSQYIRRKQASEIKKFVPQADKLIEMMTDNLVEFLKSGNVTTLIDNENKGITANYTSFLRQARTVSNSFNGKDSTIAVSNTRSLVADDLEYIKLKTSVDNVKTLRAETLLATAELRTAHAELLAIVKQRRKLKAAIAEIQEFQQGVKQIHATLHRIEKYKAPTSK